MDASYTVTIPKCKLRSTAKAVSELISAWSGSPAPAIMRAILQKNVIIRKSATYTEARELLLVFRDYGAHMDVVDTASTQSSQLKYASMRKEELNKALREGNANKYKQLLDMNEREAIEYAEHNYGGYVGPDYNRYNTSGVVSERSIPGYSYNYDEPPEAPSIMENQTTKRFDFKKLKLSKIKLKYVYVAVTVLGVLFSVCSLIPSKKPVEVVRVDSSKLECTVTDAMEFAYFEGQKDALCKDVRVARKSNGDWMWLKSPWDDDKENTQLHENPLYVKHYGGK